jgi:serine/threonine protein kinase
MSMIGKSLVHYEISAELGRGGMGEVYQAKDTKLGRDVAIKVLPEEFARDTDRVARFQREAKLLASLNHPNIAAIYGLEESEGTHFLVMELIEGDTLRDRIKSGPIPVEEALKLALQMAEALEAAHEKGVIHRDLKPANIKVTPDGKVKVLDFGLAKAYVGDQENVSPMDSPTISAAATQQGVILGTAAYMSPEQAKGKPVDKRADIWAFGVILFEMLTGRQLFTGETASETLASVMKSEPEWDNLPPNLHFRIRLLLERCLKKNPKDRYSSISDARVDIQSVIADPSGVFVQPSVIAKPKKKLQVGIPWIAVTAVLCLIIAGVAVWYLKPPETPEITRFSYELPEGQQLSDLAMKVLDVSPDGKQFLYNTTKGLYLRSTGELDAKLIAGTTDENALFPFFSSDGKWIGYGSVGKLKKIAIGGGAPVTLCDVNGIFGGGSWGTDNTIVYAQVPGEIMRVSADGGTPESLFKPEQGIYYSLPQILPDGKSVLFTKTIMNPLSMQIVVQSLGSESPKDLFVGYHARYLPTGHIVFTVGNNILDIGGHNLFAIPFDLDRLEVTGGQVPLVENIRGPYGAHFAISDSGTLVYMPGTSEVDASGTGVTPQRTLVWVDRKGNEVPLSAPSNDYQSAKISPDGTKVAMSIITSGNQDIWIWHLSRKTMTRLTFDEVEDSGPIWTPNGQRIVFYSSREGIVGGIYSKAADGTGEVEIISSGQDRVFIPSSWSNDGNVLVILEISLAPFNLDIGMLSLEGDHERTPLLQEKHVEVGPRVSPDGRWIAYQSNESGQGEIYVRPFPDVNKGKWQVSTNGGNSPLWSPDGRELFYRSGDATVAVTVETEPTFNPGNPEVLFRGPYYSPGSEQLTFTQWDISPDGKQFLMIKEPGTTGGESTAEESASTGPRKINIVLNWDEELKQRVPVD